MSNVEWRNDWNVLHLPQISPPKDFCYPPLRIQQTRVRLIMNSIYYKIKRNPKNGLVVRYRSRIGIHNMYKEYRDVSVCWDVSQMYSEMSGRHRAVYHILLSSSQINFDLGNMNFDIFLMIYKRKFDQKHFFVHIVKINIDFSEINSEVEVW